MKKPLFTSFLLNSCFAQFCKFGAMNEAYSKIIIKANKKNVSTSFIESRFCALSLTLSKFNASFGMWI